MPDLYDMAQASRSALLAGDAQLAADLTRAYMVAHRSALRELSHLNAHIAAARAAGETFSPSWLYRQQRLQNLLTRVEEEVGRFATQAGRLITDQQTLNIRMALEESRALMGEAAGATTPGLTASFVDPDPRALRELVGFMSDGTPLDSLLKTLGPAASDAVRDELTRAVATGLNPRQVARGMSKAMGGNLDRALLIARTETLRAFRETSRLSYEANSDVVGGWVWTSARDSRTCAVCYAMHGSIHDTQERFSGHPNCRCVMVPRTRSFEELGLEGVPESRPQIEPGEAAFRKLRPEQQRRILGRGRYEKWQAGEMTLGDMVDVKENQWGRTRTLRPLGKGRPPGGPTVPPVPTRPPGMSGPDPAYDAMKGVWPVGDNDEVIAHLVSDDYRTDRRYRRQKVDPATLYAGQDSRIDPDAVATMTRDGLPDFDWDEPPIVARIHERDVLIDGHHRALAAVARGEELDVVYTRIGEHIDGLPPIIRRPR